MKFYAAEGTSTIEIFNLLTIETSVLLALEYLHLLGTWLLINLESFNNFIGFVYRDLKPGTSSIILFCVSHFVFANTRKHFVARIRSHYAYRF